MRVAGCPASRITVVRVAALVGAIVLVTAPQLGSQVVLAGSAHGAPAPCAGTVRNATELARRPVRAGAADADSGWTGTANVFEDKRHGDPVPRWHVRRAAADGDVPQRGEHEPGAHEVADSEITVGQVSLVGGGVLFVVALFSWARRRARARG